MKTGKIVFQTLTLFNLSLFILLSYVGLAKAATIRVPADQPTIQAGIDAAVGGDTVLVADGTYTGVGNKNLDFSAKAITVTSESGSSNCIIDCENDGRGFLFHSGETSSSMLSGFTIINGRVDDSGGAIYCRESSSPSILNCVMQSNVAGAYGGGICISGGSPSITSCLITNNSADEGGGILYQYDGSSPSISQCTVSQNTAVGNGGGIHCADETSTTIDECSIFGNSATNGGGIYCQRGAGPTITKCKIYGNTAFYGGGLYCTTDSFANISVCIIEENVVGGNGGGVFTNCSNIIERCTIRDNIADWDAGGIHTGVYSPTITNCLITGNQAGNGGGICTGEFSCPVITNCTIANNDASGTGGAIWAWNTNTFPELKNCILWSNTPDQIRGSGISVTYSDIYGGYAGTENIDLDPVFVAAANDSYYIRSDSPCIDKGTSVGAPSLDRAGTSRPQGAAFDMGAYEYDATVVELASFTAEGVADRVLIRWKTASEIDTAGFHLWRGVLADGFYKRITDPVIPAEGGPVWGAEYVFEDRDVETGRTFFYELEDINTAGVRTFHGPVCAWAGVANIEAGKVDRVAIATQEEPVSVKVAVQAGVHAGRPVEYWVAADTPFGWYTYGAQGWKPDISPAAVGPLNDVNPLEVVNFPLPAGCYTFYLAVDDQVNGYPDLTWIDAVEVEVQPNPMPEYLHEKREGRSKGSR